MMTTQAGCMDQLVEIRSFNTEIEYDDIICLLNPVAACDLKQILMMTPLDRRLEVSLSFANVDVKYLFITAGLYESQHDATWKRWLSHKSKLPLGAAFRLAKALGVPAEILFASPKWRMEETQ